VPGDAQVRNARLRVLREPVLLGGQVSMLTLFSNLSDRLSVLHREELGQDLIEYAMVAALLTLAAIAGLPSVANVIMTALSAIGSKVSSLSS
jgi:pilus assembly protein Flp/PilA